MLNFKKYKLLFFLFLIVFGLVLLVQQYETKAQDNLQSPLVIVSEIDGEIKAGTHQYLERVINIAEEYHADYLVIKLETPGGLLKPTQNIVRLILDTPITTIVFVHKRGGWAYSAGTFILLAGDYAIVHPEASIGAAQPVVVGADDVAVEKMIEGMASWIRTLAETHQRNPDIAEKFVRENLTLSGQRAKELGVIDKTAENLDELFLKLNIIEPQIKIIELTLLERFFNFLSHPFLISLLLTIGGLGIFMAIRTGEFEVTGIIGIIALLIGLWGMGVIEWSFLGIILILIGVFLLVMEVFVEPGFGILGIGGVATIILGTFMFEAEPFLSPELFDKATMVILGAGLALCLFFVIMGKAVAKSLKSKPNTGSEALIGLEAKVTKDLKPIGQVEVNQEYWSAKSLDGKMIPKKSKVEIIKVKGNTLIVKTKK
ncbi:MAG: nodulation protein NfeD [Methanosarcinales archaeon]|nr:nodulation protein NfeD [Methanosarcinales archaeon]